MKTAISVPDPVFKKADKLAKKLRMSRSELYSKAVAEFVSRHDDDAVTAAINRVCETIDTSLPPDIAENARRMLKKVEW